MLPITKIDLSIAKQKKLHRSGQALLYDIAKRVRSGYSWWLIQEVPASKVLRTVAVLSTKYGTERTSVQRAKDKARDEAAAVLFVWPVRNDPAGYTTKFRILLLATEHLDGEIMFDARKKPPNVNLYSNRNAVFKLRGSLKDAKKPKLGYEWDWSLTAQSEQIMRERFMAQHANPAGLQRLLAAYKSLPMVSGYRRQLLEALKTTKPAWKKSTTPAVSSYKLEVKNGTKPDLFSARNVPYIRGFPKLFDDPADTLETYLAANDKLQKEVRRVQLETVRSQHGDGEV